MCGDKSCRQSGWKENNVEGRPSHVDEDHHDFENHHDYDDDDGYNDYDDEDYDDDDDDIFQLLLGWVWEEKEQIPRRERSLFQIIIIIIKIMKVIKKITTNYPNQQH